MFIHLRYVCDASSKPSQLMKANLRNLTRAAIKRQSIDFQTP